MEKEREYILLIWDSIDENVIDRIYYIPVDELSEEDMKVLELAHGNYVNEDGGKEGIALCKVQAAIARSEDDIPVDFSLDEDDEERYPVADSKWNYKWAKYCVKTEYDKYMDIGKSKKLIICGYID